MSGNDKLKTVVFALDKREIFNRHPGLIDRGAMFGLPEDVTLELITVLTDVINMHFTLTEDLSMVEDEMYNIFEFMTDPYLGTTPDPYGGYDLDDYCQQVYHAVHTLRAMIPLNIINLNYLSHIVDSSASNMVYIGGMMHLHAVPDDYLYNEHYFFFQ